jgi:hypothetical protein
MMGDWVFAKAGDGVGVDVGELDGVRVIVWLNDRSGPHRVIAILTTRILNNKPRWMGEMFLALILFLSKYLITGSSLFIRQFTYFVFPII